MFRKLLVSLVMIAVNGGILEGSVHALDLTIGPGMVGFCEAMFDVVRLTNTVKERYKGIFMVVGVGELNAVVG